MIIAIVPSPGHEALVAEGPMGERPALLRGVIGGGWYPPGQLNEHRIPDGMLQGLGTSQVYLDRPHGRRTFTILLGGEGGYVDLSVVMPRVAVPGSL